MARVKKEILEAIEKYLDNLDVGIEGKCTLCNETLTHITNQCSVQTGAPKNTISTIITKRFNSSALPADKLGNSALRNRLQQNEGIKRSKRALKKVDTTLYVPIEEYNKLKEENIDLKKQLVKYANEFEKLMLLEAKHKIKPSPKVGQLYRSVAIDYICRKGSTLQNQSIETTNPNNKRVFILLTGARNYQLKSAPPSSIPEDILNATEVINDTV